MSKKQEDRLDVDIYGLLQESSVKRKKEKRTQLLKSIGVKEFLKREASTKIPAKEWSASYASKLVPPMPFIGCLGKSALSKIYASFARPASGIASWTTAFMCEGGDLAGKWRSLATLARS